MFLGRPAVPAALLGLVLLTAGAGGLRAQPAGDDFMLDILYVTEVEEAVESEGFKPVVTRTAGPWGKSEIVDTPYSINVMSSDLIKNSGVSSFDEIAKMNPLVQLKYPNASARSTAFFNIRGFSLGQANGRLQDGVRRIFYGIPMEDKERIEVLSGLSGFLYGPTNVGGAINFVVKRPTMERTGSLLLGVKDNGTPYGHLDVGGPLDPEGRYGLRLNIAGRNGAMAYREQKQLSSVVSGAFDFHVTEDFLWRFAASHYVNKNENAPAEWWVAPGAVRPAALDPKTDLASGSRDKREQNDFSTDISWKISEQLSVRAAFLYSDMDLDYRDYKVNTFRPDGSIVSGYNIAGLNHPRTPVDQKGGYFYVDYNFETGPFAHNLTAGFSVDYLHLKMIDPPDATHPLDHDILDQRTTNASMVVGDEISFLEKYKVMLGGNFARYRVNDILNSRINKKRQFSPTVSLVYNPVEKVTLYGTYIESLEPGAFVGAGYVNSGQFLDPYVSKQYEIGAKADLGGMFLTLAWYRIDKSSNIYVVNPNGSRTMTRDGRQVHEGFELTGTGKIFDNWRVYGGLTVMRARLKNNNDRDLVGKIPVDVAESMAKLYMEYDLPFVQGLTLNGGAYHTGKMFGDALNTDLMRSVTLFDLGLSYRTEAAGHPLRFNFMLQNVADKKYWLSSYYLGNPRTFLLTSQIDFL
ncbi:MAG: TonB-dependent receptor [Deltaproteobacteria bacterium]|nr:TonB-dependent receptor [Deltaproteobacteria bacterium]